MNKNFLSPQTKKTSIPVEYIEQTSLDGVPLDFSFKEIKELSDIITMTPRKGARKPIPLNAQATAAEEEQANKNKAEETKKIEQSPNNGQSAADDEEKKEGEENRNEEANKQEEEKQQQEAAQAQAKRAAADVKLNPETKLASIFAQYNVPFHNTNPLRSLVAGSKTQQKEEVTLKQSNKKYKLKLITTAVILSYNQIRSLNNLTVVIDSVMHDAFKNLLWLDLSHNYLETLSEELMKFEQLKSLYLHFNYIKNLEELEKLKELKNLNKLMVHGNPIDQLPGYRTFVIGIVPQVKTLDTVVVSKKEKDNAYTWYNTFKKKYPHLKVDPKNEKLGKTLKEVYPEYFPPEVKVVKKEEDD